MTDGFTALTEKEKEALRLMVRGHDAKSMARELSLSVHTINDRLRGARRKLGVTSSREAARIVLEREGGAPESLVGKDLGGASQEALKDKQEIAGSGLDRRFIAGVLIMISFIAAAIIFASQPSTEAPVNEFVEAPASDAEVVAAARDWLALYDAGDWQAGYEAAGAAFRKVNSPSDWAGAAGQVRPPLGEMISREVLTVRYLNAPPRGYQEIVFTTRYSQVDNAVLETVTLEREDGVWKIVGIL